MPQGTSHFFSFFADPYLSPDAPPPVAEGSHAAVAVRPRAGPTFLTCAARRRRSLSCRGAQHVPVHVRLPAHSGHRLHGARSFFLPLPVPRSLTTNQHDVESVENVTFCLAMPLEPLIFKLLQGPF